VVAALDAGLDVHRRVDASPWAILYADGDGGTGGSGGVGRKGGCRWLRIRNISPRGLVSRARVRGVLLAPADRSEVSATTPTTRDRFPSGARVVAVPALVAARGPLSGQGGAVLHFAGGINAGIEIG
jgi:hypothetical protein